jgi:LPS sulfotransferase NodH
MGYPDEYLLQWERWCVRFGLSAGTPLDEYLSCLVRHRLTPNGVFGIKGSLSQLEPFFDLFSGAPCVWLVRENKVEQAVSWQRANDGGHWHRQEGGKKPPPHDASVERILGFYDELMSRHAAWQDFFAARNVQPLLLTYEKVCRDPLAGVQAIADHIGVELDGVEQVTSSLQILRDETTEHWVRCTEEALNLRG